MGYVFLFSFFVAAFSPLHSICIVAERFVASQGPLGEHYEAGELGGIDTGGVEGEQEVRAMRVWQMDSLAVDYDVRHASGEKGWLLSIMVKSLYGHAL